MHDPMILIGSIRLPIPKSISNAEPPAPRWRAGWSPFWHIAGYEVYFGHNLVDVWHIEPDDKDAGSVCGYIGLWKHVKHLRFRFPLLRRLRRRMFTTCEWCGESGTLRHPVNVSHQWDSDDPAHWWHGERGKFHRECSTAQTASRMCTCVNARPGSGPGTSRCQVCDLFIDHQQLELALPRRLAKKIGRDHRRPTRSEAALISQAFKDAREPT